MKSKGRCSCSGIVKYDPYSDLIYCHTCGKVYDKMPEWVPTKITVPKYSRRQMQDMEAGNV